MPPTHFHDCPFSRVQARNQQGWKCLRGTHNLAGWTLGLSPDTIIDLAPGAQQSVTPNFTPPADLPIPGTAVVDVEAYIGGKLIGGFRELHYPPHTFADGFESGGSAAWSAEVPEDLH